MLKLRNVILSLLVLGFTVMSAFADGDNAGCRNGKFVGSYTRTVPNNVYGDGSVIHQTIFQLNLHGDGTAFQYWTGFPDALLTTGTNSPYMGSWKCRQDGQLVVTLITAVFQPTTVTHGPAPVDLLLDIHARTTYLFTVTDEDTLTRTEARSRIYTTADDPSDPTAGTLND